MRFPRMAATNLELTLSLVAWSPGARAQSLAGAIEQAWLRNLLASTLEVRQDEALASIDLPDCLTPGEIAGSLSAQADRFHCDEGAQKREMELGVPLWVAGAAGGTSRRSAKSVGTGACATLAVASDACGRSVHAMVGAGCRANRPRPRARRAPRGRGRAVQAQALVQAQEVSLRAITGVEVPPVLEGEAVTLQSIALVLPAREPLLTAGLDAGDRQPPGDRVGDVFEDADIATAIPIDCCITATSSRSAAPATGCARTARWPGSTGQRANDIDDQLIINRGAALDVVGASVLDVA